MNEKIRKLRERLEALRSELLELAEIDEPTEAQAARWTEANTEFDTLRAEHDAEEARAARLDEIRKFAGAPAHVEKGADERPESFQFVRGGDVFDMSEIRSEVRSGDSEALRSRALKAVETAPRWVKDEHRESVERLIDDASHRTSGEIAKHVLLTGSDQYRNEFQAYLATGEAGPALRDVRASLTLTGGAAMIPYTMDPTLILTNNGATNPFRGISDVRTITTDDLTVITSAGVTAEWLAESTQVADATPTIGSVTITPAKAAAHIQVSMEFDMDSSFSSEIQRLFADARDRLEATAFATGSGSGQPYGIVTELQLVTASRVAGSSGAAGAADLVAADIYAVDAALPPRHRPGASWVGEKTNWNKVRQLGTSTTFHAFWSDFGGGLPAQLIGYPVYESSAMDSTIVSGSNDDIIILGDFRAGYCIVDRVGMSVIYNPLVQGANNRPNGEHAWTAFWRVGARAKDANAFRMLRL